MSEIKEITEKIIKFRDDRDWKQFHNPKDLSEALSIEASELLECFLWKKPEEANESDVKEELADILNYCFLIAHHYNLDIKKIMMEKIEKNNQKYPIDKAKGKSDKYDKL